MLRVKICGIRTLPDALAAIEAGADLLGFNFFPRSKRYLAPEACRSISQALEKEFPYILRIGVFVNTPPEEVRSTLQQAQLHLAQLHGDEPFSWLEASGENAFKAVRLAEKLVPGRLAELLQFARLMPGDRPAILVDASVSGEYGGTGRQANWQAAEVLARRVPLLLAGGLTPDNVRQAVRQVQPWGVDTASGVEVTPGEKDAGKMKAFVRAARADMD